MHKIVVLRFIFCTRYITLYNIGSNLAIFCFWLRRCTTHRFAFKQTSLQRATHHFLRLAQHILALNGRSPFRQIPAAATAASRCGPAPSPQAISAQREISAQRSQRSDSARPACTRQDAYPARPGLGVMSRPR